jgi:hypothetical protein
LLDGAYELADLWQAYARGDGGINVLSRPCRFYRLRRVHPVLRDYRHRVYVRFKKIVERRRFFWYAVPRGVFLELDSVKIAERHLADKRVRLKQRDETLRERSYAYYSQFDSHKISSLILNASTVIISQKSGINNIIAKKIPKPLEIPVNL